MHVYMCDCSLKDSILGTHLRVIIQKKTGKLTTPQAFRTHTPTHRRNTLTLFMLDIHIFCKLPLSTPYCMHNIRPPYNKIEWKTFLKFILKHVDGLHFFLENCLLLLLLYIFSISL